MVHDRKTPLGVEHAEAMRHVIKGGIELVCERRFAFAGHNRSHEDSVQIGRQLHDCQKKRGAHD
jgi:hypothetical protein